MTPGPVVEEFELRDYLRVVWQRKWVVILIVLAATGGAVAYSSSQTPLYETGAEVLLQSRSTDTLFGFDAIRDPVRLVPTEIRLIQSQPVRDAVTKSLGDAPPVSAKQVGDTEIIEVIARDPDPQRAAVVANAYANAYIDFRRTQAVDDVITAAAQVQGKISDLQPQIDGASGPERQALVDRQNLFQKKLDELQVDRALKTGGAQMATPASAPLSPASPNPVRSGLTALVGALILATALVFLLEYLDDSVKTNEDVEKLSGSPPVVGRVPVVSGWRPKDTPFVVSSARPKSFPAESYRALRTAVHFLALDDPIRTLQVTSPGASAGKTTTVANLAVAMSAAGQRVLILCCDLRRPRIHEFFGLDNAIGFTSVLLGQESVSTALQVVPGHKSLYLMASGPLPPNPSELLSSARTIELLESLQAIADIVLIDSPPVLPVTDALVLSGRVDATLLVCVAGATTRKEVARSVEQLRRVQAPLVGAVLNGVVESSNYGGGYRGYTYDHPRPTRRAGRKWRSEGTSPKRGSADEQDARTISARRERDAERSEEELLAMAVERRRPHPPERPQAETSIR